MPDYAPLEDYTDRRRHSRRSVYRTAELILRGSGGGLDCTVLDEFEGGVQVELSQALELPEELMIKFSDMASQLVRRCWAKGTRAGYQYVEIVPAHRRLFNDAPPPAQAAPADRSFVAFNDFIHISRPLLDLAGEPVEWLYPAEQIHELLADVLDEPDVFKVKPELVKEWLGELFSMATTTPAGAVEIYFGPRWMSKDPALRCNNGI